MSVPAYVSLITLGVTDLDRATAFYRGLGWPLSPASVPGEASFFAIGGCALALFGDRALAADAGVDAGAPVTFRGVATAINVGTPAEVDAALAAAATGGGRLVKAGERVAWGGYSGYFADPDGHLWEVAHNPYWELGADGRVTLPE